MVVVMGDFNAMIGSNNAGFEEIMGKEGLGEMNENGLIFANFCDTFDMVIGGSVFKHKRIHKATWRHPDQHTENQIDHITFARKYRRCFEDVKVRRGADVGSDHNLVIAKVKLKLKKNWADKTSQRVRFDTTLLKNPVKKEEFRINLSNRWQVLQGLEEDDVNEKWLGIKNAAVSSCKEVLGQKRRVHKPWISQETLKSIEERRVKKSAILNSRTREEKRKAAAEYNEANNEVKESAKKDKTEYMESLAQTAEEAASYGDSHSLYATIKTLSGNFGKPEVPVKSKEGKSIPGEKEQMERWVHHFKELLNRPPPANHNI